MRDSIRKGSIVSLGVITAGLSILAAPAQAAYWDGELKRVPVGYESRRWYEPNTATRIKFTDCATDLQAVHVRLAKDISWSPDTYYSNQGFTNCLKGYNYTSTGDWNAHGNGDYYFIINDGAVGASTATVRTLTVSY